MDPLLNELQDRAMAGDANAQQDLDTLLAFSQDSTKEVEAKMSEQEEQIIAWEELELENTTLISEAVIASSNYEIKWHSTQGQWVKVNECYTVPVIGMYKPQGHLITIGIGPSFLSFVGPWVEGTSELVDVPAPCNNWQEVLEAYKSHELLVPLFFTYQQASDWLVMLDKREAFFGGTLSVMKHDKVQGLTISYDGYNHRMFYDNDYNNSGINHSRDGLWEAERAVHSSSEFITSIEVNDEDDEYYYSKFVFIDMAYLEDLSPQELRKAACGYLHFSDQYLYHTFANWQIEMIKAADKGDKLAFTTSIQTNLNY
jgi:hypothetical protein